MAGFVLAALGLSAAAATLVASLRPPWTPVLLLPICLGLALGLAVRAIFVRLELRDRRLLLGMALLTGLATAGGQHYAAFRHYRHEYLQSTRDPRWQLLEATRADMGAPSFAGFMRAQATAGRSWIGGTWRGPKAWVTWGVDGLLLIVASILAARYRPAAKVKAAGIDAGPPAGQHEA
ncbi:MAG: hypothetical protein AB7O62_09080 [Pirellulales bacterium]